MTRPIWGRVVLVLSATIALSGCISSIGGPNDNAPEKFEFTAGPAARADVEQAFKLAMGPQFDDVVPESFVAIGRIVGARGDQLIAEFQMNDPANGLSQCSGQAGQGSAGWGCGPVGQEEIVNTEPLLSGGSSFDGTWATAEFTVSDDVEFLVATADDGTRYRMEPIAGHAWMEWRSEHGDLVVNAFDVNDAIIGTTNVGVET